MYVTLKLSYKRIHARPRRKGDNTGIPYFQYVYTYIKKFGRYVAGKVSSKNFSKIPENSRKITGGF